MRFPYSYKKVHAELNRMYGPAKNHVCACGETAAEWAYQFTAGDQELRGPDGKRPHSPNPSDYAPMCRACHVGLDMNNDPTMVAAKRKSGGFREELVQKWENDPEYSEKMREVLRRNSAAIAERQRTDPQFREIFVESGRRAGKRLAMKMKADPEYAAQVTKTLTDNAKVRVRCNVCSMVSNRAGMGNHRRFSGHDDWVFVNEEEK